jgi:hypothetical protein
MIKSIENLTTEYKFTNKMGNTQSYYDLTIPTFVNSLSSLTNYYTTTNDDNMRLDNISNNLLGDSDLLDLLMFINDYDNPLNVMQGDIIYYCNSESINLFQNNTDTENKLQISLIQNDKSTIVDSNRSKYKNSNYSLPPTINSTPNPGVNISGNNIIIG